MQNSKELLRVAGILPKLRLGTKLAKGGVQATGPHKVTLISDKIQKGKDKETGKVINVVKYIVEENGEQKQYIVPVKDRDSGELHYLVQRLAEVSEGQEIILEMKKQGIKNYIEITSADGSPIVPQEEDESEADDIHSDETGEEITEA